MHSKWPLSLDLIWTLSFSIPLPLSALHPWIFAVYMFWINLSHASVFVLSIIQSLWLHVSLLWTNSSSFILTPMFTYISIHSLLSRISSNFEERGGDLLGSTSGNHQHKEYYISIHLIALTISLALSYSLIHSFTHSLTHSPFLSFSLLSFYLGTKCSHR